LFSIENLRFSGLPAATKVLSDNTTIDEGTGIDSEDIMGVYNPSEVLTKLSFEEVTDCSDTESENGKLKLASHLRYINSFALSLRTYISKLDRKFVDPSIIEYLQLISDPYKMIVYFYEFDKNTNGGSGRREMNSLNMKDIFESVIDTFKAITSDGDVGIDLTAYANSLRIVSHGLLTAAKPIIDKPTIISCIQYESKVFHPKLIGIVDRIDYLYSDAPSQIQNARYYTIKDTTTTTSKTIQSSKRSTMSRSTSSNKNVKIKKKEPTLKTNVSDLKNLKYSEITNLSKSNTELKQLASKKQEAKKRGKISRKVNKDKAEEIKNLNRPTQTPLKFSKRVEKEKKYNTKYFSKKIFKFVNPSLIGLLNLPVAK
jgi:hypothetical protein